MIVLERLATAMGLPAVDFDNEAEIAPEEVDTVAADLDVDLSYRQAAAT